MIQRESFTSHELAINEEAVSETIHTTLQSSLNNNGWKKLVDENYHLLIKEIHVKHFMPHNNSLPNILKTIQNIKFTSLQQINIQTNADRNGFLRSLMVQQSIDYGGVNDVISIREFRKSHWPELTSLGLNKNKIKEGHYLTLMHLPNLARNTVFELSGGDQVQSQDVSWTAKMMIKPVEECKSQIQIKFNSKQRIKQSSVKKALSRKHQHISLIYAL